MKPRIIMAEAVAVVGLVSAVGSLTKIGSNIIGRLKDAKHSIRAFDDIANQLPVILQSIEVLKSESVADIVDQSSGPSLLRAVEGCQRQVIQLEELLDSCVISAGDGTAQKVFKAGRAVRSEKRIRSILDILETYKTTLILHLGRSNTSSKSTPSPIEHRFVRLPALQVSCFVGRDVLIRDLIKGLVPSNPPKVMCLHAMGGQGKTQIALECCRQLQRSAIFHTIIWIDATSENTMNAEYSLLFNKLARNTPPAPSLDKAQYSQQRLEDWPEPFLLVFDNCDQRAALQAVKEHLPKNPHGVTLCTSRHLDCDRLGQVISVPAMSESEASELLFLRCKAERTDENAAKASQITEVLGCLPLAVDQAASYIKGRRLPLTTFLKQYETRKDAILKHIPDGWEYQKSHCDDVKKSSLSVFAIWELAIDEFDREHDNSYNVSELLSFLAFVHYQSIPEKLCRCYARSISVRPPWVSQFIVDGQWNSGRYQDLVAKLLARSLITNMELCGEDTSVSLHPLVQMWARLRLSILEQQRNALAAMNAIARAYPAQALSKEKDFWVPSLTHYREVYRHLNLFPSRQQMTHLRILL